LAIRYQPAGEGQELDAGALRCKSVNSTAEADVELLRGVADFRLDFGVGNKGMLERVLKDDSDANRFKTAGSWDADDGPIRAVRYSILMAGGERLRDSADSAVLESWLSTAGDADKARLQGGDNRRIYQIAHNTRNLRNLMP
jgi:type IV pilus assembly protein PilW